MTIRLLLVRRALAVAAWTACVASCGDPASRQPAGPSGPAILSIEISGPSSVGPGQSAQFTVVIHMSDGTAKTATNPLWHSANTSLLQVNSSGFARAGQQMGEVILSVDVIFTTRSLAHSSREVVIVPDGTYRVVGTVKDAEFSTLSLPGARLDVTPGSISTATDLGGNYRLYGVPAESQLRISEDGYQPLVQNLHLTANSTLGFQLTLSGPRLNLTGSYTLTIDAAPGCSGPGSLPAEFQHRSYAATVIQGGPNVVVTLTEPRFKVNSSGKGNQFSGRATGTGATFTLDSYSDYYYYYYHSYPSIAERLSNGTILVVDGGAVTTGTAAGLSGVLNGGISNWDSRFPNGSFFGTCYSSAHQFTLTPR